MEKKVSQKQLNSNQFTEDANNRQTILASDKNTDKGTILNTIKY